MRNEEAHIGTCIESILAQTYPLEHIEILVYDGGSTDQSRSIVNELAAASAAIVLLDNPKRIQAVAWNLGIDRAKGDVIGIISAHAELAPDYVARALETLERTEADMVGGPMRAYGNSSAGRAIALATSTPFGIGGGRFHYATTEVAVDTVYMGLCTAAVYRSLRFDEEMVRNQDDELSYRLLDRGGRIVCNPAIRSRYRNRESIAALARQYFSYGYWKVRVIMKHPRQARARHLIPAVFVAALASSTVASAISQRGRYLLLAVGGSYGMANLAAAWLATKKSTVSWRLVALSYTALHLSYGTGFLMGVAREGHYQLQAIWRSARGARRP